MVNRSRIVLVALVLSVMTYWWIYPNVYKASSSSDNFIIGISLVALFWAVYAIFVALCCVAFRIDIFGD